MLVKRARSRYVQNMLAVSENSVQRVLSRGQYSVHTVRVSFNLATIVYCFDNQLNIAGTRSEGEKRGRSQCEKVLHLNEILDVSGQDLMSVDAKIIQSDSKTQNISIEISQLFIDVSPYLNDGIKIRAF